jgi:hypothetical protein
MTVLMGCIGRDADSRDPDGKMSFTDSALDPEAMTRARTLLETPKPRERLWPVLGAAALLALSALAFATAMIMAPPVISEHVLKPGP